MKINACLFSVWAGVIFSLASANALALTDEQKAVRQFIGKMYSYDPDTFEYGEFNGRYRPEKQCALWREFFVEKLLTATKLETGKAECNVAQVRYPSLSDEDLSSATRYMPIPTPKIGTPFIYDGKAKVAVMTREGRTLYFLTKTEKGWRISNALLNRKWPETIDDKCLHEFIVKPTREEVQELMPQCR